MIDGIPLMKRSAAKAAGMARYVSGKPCPAGHNGERYVSTGQCTLCLLQHKKKWLVTNIDRSREYARERYWKNPGALCQKALEWRQQNPERTKELNVIWHLRNPHGRKTHNSNRRAREKNAPGTYTHDQITHLADVQKWKCVYCSVSLRKSYHIDHIKPFALGGTNEIQNIQLLCPACNMRKHAKHPINFARENGLLL